MSTKWCTSFFHDFHLWCKDQSTWYKTPVVKQISNYNPCTFKLVFFLRLDLCEKPERKSNFCWSNRVCSGLVAATLWRELSFCRPTRSAFCRGVCVANTSGISLTSYSTLVTCRVNRETRWKHNWRTNRSYNDNSCRCVLCAWRIFQAFH